MKDSVEIRVWWIPQVPGDAFEMAVPTLADAKLLCEALARYDLFQLEHNIRPDYANAGGASWRHPVLTDGRWYDFDPEQEDQYEEIAGAVAKAAAL